MRAFLKIGLVSGSLAGAAMAAWPAVAAAGSFAVAASAAVPVAVADSLSPAPARLRPPAEVEFAEPAPPPLPPRLPPPAAAWRDADWWLRAVSAWRADQPPGYLAAPEAAPRAPSVAPLRLAGAGRAAARAAACRPDSAASARRRLWRLASSWLPPAVRPWLRARARAEAYHAIKVREAELYDDTAFPVPLVTDTPAPDAPRQR